MPQKKKLNSIPPEDASISNYLMQKNRDKNFVQRAYNNNTAPRLQTNKIPGYGNKPSNMYSTELMSYDPGSQRVYPEIVQRPGQKGLEYLGGDRAWDYADSTGEYIQMPPSEKIMKMFSDYGYKHAAGIPMYKIGGTYHGGPIGKHQWELPSSPNTPGYEDYGSMYYIPGGYGLYEKPRDYSKEYAGYGNPANLLSNQQDPVPTYAGPRAPVRGVKKNNPDNFYAGEGSTDDYSIDKIRQQYKKGGQTMRVKITGVPKESTIPTNKVNPFSVPDEFKYGGALPSTGPFGNNRRIDTYSDFLRQPMKGTTYQESPYSHTGRELPEVPEGTPDAIVVEKQEQVMGDFNGDGMPVLMGTNVGTHDSGDDLTTVVPDGSFVFSDTPSLKIKDPQILAIFGMKSAATPAQIAKKYDLQKYKKILDDPDRSEIDKNTARLMYQNCIDKLNLLASIQEDMKKKQDKMRQGRQYAKGGSTSDLRKEQQYLQDTYPQGVIGANMIYGYPQSGSFVDGMEGPRTEFVRNFSTQPPIQGNIANPFIEPPPIIPVGSPSIPYTPQMRQVPEYIPHNELSIKKEKGKSKTGSDTKHTLNPDTLAAITTGLRYAQYPDYNPIRQVAHAAIPNAVYLDPTRAKAAIQEGVNSATNAIAMGATGPVSRANILALQGKAGVGAASIEADYAEKNAQIANRTNEQAAQIYNQMWRDQQNYNKEYVEETHNAQMDKLGYQNTVQNEMLKQAYLAEDRNRNAQNYNYINPYYTMDSRGYIYPKSEEQLKAVQALGNRVGKGSFSTPSKEIEKLIASGNYSPETIEYLRRLGAKKDVEAMLGPIVSERIDPRTGMVTSMSRRGRDIDNDGDINRRGGPVKKSKIKITGVPMK